MLTKSKIKYIQSLGQKKFRQQEKLFIAEGPKLAEELLKAKQSPVAELFAVRDWMEANRQHLGTTTITEVLPHELEKISQLTTPNQVLAVVRQWENKQVVAVKNNIILALDGIRDPGNLGTIIRIADWFGVGQLVCSADCAELYNAKVVQATMGSIGRVNVFYTDMYKWLLEQETRVYATALEGRDIRTIEKIKEGIIVTGSEANGISEAILERSNVRVTIPKRGEAESLNAAVATGIVLSHLT